MKTQEYSVLLNFTIFGKEYSIEKYNFMQDPYFVGTKIACTKFIDSQRTGKI